ncbi:unnamed protein product, partial [Closterium sp. NIES-64]
MLRVRTSSSPSDSQSSQQSWRGWPAAASSVARRHATSLRRTLSVAALPLLLLAYVAVRLTIAPHYQSALTEPGATTRKPRRVEALRVFIVPLDPSMSFGLLNVRPRADPTLLHPCHPCLSFAPLMSSSQLSLSIPARLVPTWNRVTGSNVPLPPSLALTTPALALSTAAPPSPSAAALVQGEAGDDLGTAEEGSGEEKEEEMVSVQVAAYDAESHVYTYSAEYWLTLSLFTGAPLAPPPLQLRLLPCERLLQHTGWLPAVRVVEHPSQADALFLPLFSSLLLLRSGPPNASAAFSLRTPPALLDSVLSYVASLLQQHQPARAPLPLLLPAVHAHALAPAKRQLASARFFLADFRHSSPQAVSVGKDVLVPLASPVPPVLDDTGEWAHRPTLAFFHGPPQTQERVRLAAVLASSMDFEVTVWGDVHSNEQHEQERARERHGMRTAKFCLLLPGELPWSAGMGDAVMSGCVPVLLLPAKLPAPFLPLEASVPYKEFSLVLPLPLALRPRYLLEALGVVKRHQWLRMWNRLRK